MSANVWFEEVNTGLIQEIRKYVKVVDPSGNKVLIDPESVIVRKPEEDFKIEVFPCVSVYNKSYKHDPIRNDPIPVKVGYNTNKNTVEMEEPAVPYNLSYQIDFWAKYQVDMDCMTRTWLFNHFRQFNLDVVDDGGIERSCNCLCVGQITKSDLVLNKERLFHSIANLEIWVELDEERRYNMPMAVRYNVDAGQKGEEDG